MLDTRAHTGRHLPPELSDADFRREEALRAAQRAAGRRFAAAVRELKNAAAECDMTDREPPPGWDWCSIDECGRDWS